MKIIRQKAQQVKAYLFALQSPKIPLHIAFQEEKGCGLATGESGMGQAEQSIHLFSFTQSDWAEADRRLVKCSDEFKPSYKALLPEKLVTH